jgi:SAM-dependent methyltransferase
MKTTASSQPWQLAMFRRSLKKQQKLNALLQMAGSLTEKKGLLVTCGDNNGALNWFFRSHGGDWTWGDVAGENLAEMSALLGEPVHPILADHFPFEDETFDCAISVDVLEHLDEDQPFLREFKRVVKPGGLALVTVPNGDPQLLANRIKWRMGMTLEIYGHTRAGYTHAELREAMQRAGFTPERQGGYSRFFTEMIELAVNFGYVFVLSRKKGGAKEGHIAPTSSGELKTHGAAYWLYSLVYPVLNLFSQLDRLLPARTDNAVIVAANKK